MDRMTIVSALTVITDVFTIDWLALAIHLQGINFSYRMYLLKIDSA
jgi:hypothetical protein